MTNPALPLAGEFPAAGVDEWRALVAGVLTKAGRPFDAEAPERALAHLDYDGITVAPLYLDRPGESDADSAGDGTAGGRPGQQPYLRGSQGSAGAGWDVRARYLAGGSDAAARVNTEVLTDLDNGISSLWLPAGLELARVLSGVYLDLVSVVLDDPAQTDELLALTADLDPAEVRGNLGADPIGTALRTGAEADLSGLGDLVQAAGSYPNLRPITVDGLLYHEAGGTDADELAISLSVAVAYLRELGEQHFDQLEFRYAVTANQFASIAKLRAARRLWDRVGELCGLTERTGQRQHAVTSAAMLTRRDPWVNLLRSTIACFAAAVGGAGSITVLPFDSALGVPDDFGRRIARNTQSILHDESSLARVLDAAGGSYYVETLSEELAATAWTKFTALEAAGGATNATAVRELLAGSWDRRRARLATREDPLTGVSEFANLAEDPITRSPAGPGAADGDGLPVHRYAEEYEALRDRSDAILAAIGSRPSVLLAALGPVSAHSGRVGFATNLFAAGGVQSVVVAAGADPAGGPSAFDDLVAGFQASGARIACLCSSDRVYDEQAAAAAAALREAGATVWIAGSPDRAVGDISQSIQLGVDALARLAEVYAELGADGADGADAAVGSVDADEGVQS